MKYTVFGIVPFLVGGSKVKNSILKRLTYIVEVKIEMWYIGKTSFAFVREGTAEFGKRINRYNGFQEVCIPDVKSGKNHPPAQIKKAEADKLLSLLKSDDFLILLDEKGKTYRSMAFSKQLNQWLLSSKKRIIFLIGGAWGFDQRIYYRANAKLSLSDMTFSHQLIRLIFVEQLYRAFSILNNEKYHNE